MIGRPPVPDDKGLAVRAAGRAVAGEPFDGEPMAGGAGDDVLLALVIGQGEQGVQAGRDAGDAHVRGVLPHRGSQPVTPPPVDEPGVADLPVVAAGREEPAWRETPFFTTRERAALAFTEAVTLLARLLSGVTAGRGAGSGCGRCRDGLGAGG